jgi:plasmid stabilization system protein ParE
VKRAEFHLEAEVEFADAVDFYDAENEGLGAGFTDEVEQATQFVRTHPEAGRPVRGMIRRWRVQRFPYYIIYREESERVYILAVAHQRRRPGYWAERT